MTEAYKVGITIALTNQISRGLFLIQGDLAKTDAKAKQLHATLKEIKLLGIGGAILGGIGYAGLHALGKTLSAAKEYQQALAQFKSLNLGDAINSQADKFAQRLQRHRGFRHRPHADDPRPDDGPRRLRPREAARSGLLPAQIRQPGRLRRPRHGLQRGPAPLAGKESSR